MEVIKQLDVEIATIYVEKSSRRMSFSASGHPNPMQRQLDEERSPRLLPSVSSSTALERSATSFENAIIKTARKVSRSKQSFGLPITFYKIEAPATVMSCADTGSNINAISADLARDLGLAIEPLIDNDPVEFQIGSGK